LLDSSVEWREVRNEYKLALIPMDISLKIHFYIKFMTVFIMLIFLYFLLFLFYHFCIPIASIEPVHALPNRTLSVRQETILNSRKMRNRN